MNINDTILRQYSNSPKIKNIIYTFNNGVDVTNIVNNFYDDIFNLETAKSYGLDIWSRIVDVSRYVKFEELGDTFGFKDQNLQTFNNGSFYSGVKSTNTLRLSDDFFRLVIKSKAAVNISNSTIKDTNRILSSIFSNKGTPFVTDNLDMTMHYVFPFYLSDSEISLIKNSNILPRPSGVKLRGIITIPKQVFGFFGSNCQTFNNGAFINTKGIIDVN